MKFLLALVLVTPLFAAPPAQRMVAAVEKQTYIGLSSDSAMTGTATPALSALLTLTDKMDLQTYVVVPGIDPFTFSVAGAAKYTVFGTQQSGVHIGGGLGFELAATGAAATNADDTRDLIIHFNGILGAHFTLVNRVMIIADGGALLSLNADKSDADLSVGGNSALLGVSLLYQI